MPKEKTRILFPFVKLDLGSDRLLSFYSKFYQGNDNIDFREDNNKQENVFEIESPYKNKVNIPTDNV